MPFPRRASPTRLVALLGLLCTPVVATAQGGHSTDRDYGDQRAPQTWSLEPRLKIEPRGDDSLGYEFAFIAGVVLAPDGGVVVANGNPPELRFFDATGRFRRSAGRRGEGPGEFNRVLWNLFRWGDSLLGVDNGDRAQVFHVNGEYVRSLPRPRASTTVFPSIIGVLTSGDVIVTSYGTSPPGRPAADSTLIPIHVWRMHAADSLAPVAALPGYNQRTVAGRARSFHFDAMGVVAAGADRVCAGYSAAYDISCYDGRGRRLFRVRRDVQRRRTTAADREFLVTDHIASNPGVPVERLRAEATHYPVASRVPAFGSIMVSDTGELWVSEFDVTSNRRGAGALLAPARPVRWNVFGRDGAWLADVVLPARFFPWSIGRDYVAGVAFGTDDVESVAVHRVRRDP